MRDIWTKRNNSCVKIHSTETHLVQNLLVMTLHAVIRITCTLLMSGNYNLEPAVVMASLAFPFL